MPLLVQYREISTNLIHDIVSLGSNPTPAQCKAALPDAQAAARLPLTGNVGLDLLWSPVSADMVDGLTACAAGDSSSIAVDFQISHDYLNTIAQKGWI